MKLKLAGGEETDSPDIIFQFHNHYRNCSIENSASNTLTIWLQTIKSYRLIQLCSHLFLLISELGETEHVLCT